MLYCNKFGSPPPPIPYYAICGQPLIYTPFCVDLTVPTLFSTFSEGFVFFVSIAFLVFHVSIASTRLTLGGVGWGPVPRSDFTSEEAEEGEAAWPRASHIDHSFGIPLALHST